MTIAKAPSSTDRAVYTVAETAQLLSLSRTTTYALVRAGEIPAKKIGNRWVIPKVRLHEWVNEPDDLFQPEPSSREES